MFDESKETGPMFQVSLKNAGFVGEVRKFSLCDNAARHDDFAGEWCRRALCTEFCETVDPWLAYC